MEYYYIRKVEVSDIHSFIYLYRISVDKNSVPSTALVLERIHAVIEYGQLTTFTHDVACKEYLRREGLSSIVTIDIIPKWNLDRTMSYHYKATPCSQDVFEGEKKSILKLYISEDYER